MTGSSFIKSVTQTLERELNSRRIKAINSIIFVTYRCTSRCNTCNIWKWADKGSDLTAEKFEQMVDKLYRSGVRTVEIFGGDALLRKDIVNSILKRCSALGLDSFFPTNSNLLDQETAQGLVSGGLGTIYFSIDGINNLHDNIRGVKGTFIRVKEAMWNIYNAKSQLRAKKPEIGSITTVSNMNVEMIENLLFEMQNFPVSFVYLQALGEVTQEDVEHSIIEGIRATPPFISTSKNSNLLSERQFIILSDTLKRLKEKRNKIQFHLGLRHIEPLEMDTFIRGIFPAFPCHICTTVATLTPSGEVVPCPYFTDFILGSLVNEDSLDNIWGNNKHRLFLKRQRRGEFAVCRKCSMRHFYPGLKENFRQVFFPYIYALSFPESAAKILQLPKFK